MAMKVYFPSHMLSVNVEKSLVWPEEFWPDEDRNSTVYGPGSAAHRPNARC